MFGLTEDDRLIYFEFGKPADCAVSFTTKGDLAARCEENNWSKARVTEIWNANAEQGSLFGLTKVKRFRNRPYGIDRLWEMAQKLKESTPASEVAAPDKPEAKAPEAKTQARNGEAHKDSKRAKALALMSREGGVSGAELQKALDWLPHTVRGFISTLQSKHGVKVETEKSEAGRVYKVIA